MKASDVLSRDEIQLLTARSDWQAAKLVIINWGLIALAFGAVALWTNPLTIVAAIVLIGGRQLGLGVIMHECGHNTFFRSTALNRFVGRWLASYPIFSDMDSYAKGHLEHHKKAGTAEDPDLPNYQAYPVSKASLRRKIIRDLSGQTGLKFWGYILKNQKDAMSRSIRGDGVFGKALLTNAVLLALLALAGHAWLYLLWLVAFSTTYFLFLRIRQIGEHGAVPDLHDLDPRRNTRTTYARWWEKLLVCPIHVHYHLEHHMLASVPAYNLRRMHQMMKARGAYDGMSFPVGYFNMLRSVIA